MQDKDSESERKETNESCQIDEGDKHLNEAEYVLGLIPGQFKQNFKKRAQLSQVLAKLDKLSKRNFKQTKMMNQRVSSFD